MFQASTGQYGYKKFGTRARVLPNHSCVGTARMEKQRKTGGHEAMARARKDVKWAEAMKSQRSKLQLWPNFPEQSAVSINKTIGFIRVIERQQK